MFVEDKGQGGGGAVVHPSREGMAAWLRTKDPGEYYDWTGYGHCACAQYAKSIGRFPEWVDHSNDGIWGDLNGAAGAASLHARGTFGSLLKELVAGG